MIESDGDRAIQALKVLDGTGFVALVTRYLTFVLSASTGPLRLEEVRASSDHSDIGVTQR
jgi:hypothetical protein